MSECIHDKYVECDSCRAFANLERKLKIAEEALDYAIDLITAEYCSHDGEHGIDACYAQKQIAALKEIRKGWASLN